MSKYKDFAPFVLMMSAALLIAMMAGQDAKVIWRLGVSWLAGFMGGMWLMILLTEGWGER